MLDIGHRCVPRSGRVSALTVGAIDTMQDFSGTGVDLLLQTLDQSGRNCYLFPQVPPTFFTFHPQVGAR
jgi:hypothetical protein